MAVATASPRTMYPSSPVHPGVLDFIPPVPASSDPLTLFVTTRDSVLDALGLLHDAIATNPCRMMLWASPQKGSVFIGGTGSIPLFAPNTELLVPASTINNITSASPAVFTTAANHGLVTGQTVTLQGTDANGNQAGGKLDGTGVVASTPSGTTFTVTGFNSTGTGSAGSVFTSGLATIVDITAANPPVLTTSTAHGLAAGEIIRILGSNCTPSIDGVWAVASVTSTTITLGQAQNGQALFAVTTAPDPATGFIYYSAHDFQKPGRHLFITDELTRLGCAITANTAANPSVFTTDSVHGLKVGQTVKITNSNSTPSASGSWLVATVPSTTTFTLLGLGNVTVAGTSGNIDVPGPSLDFSTGYFAGQTSGMRRVLPANYVVGLARAAGGAGSQTGLANVLVKAWRRDYLG